MEDTANTKISYIFILSVWLAQIRGADIKTAGIAPRRPIPHRVDELTARLKEDGFAVVSGPRTTGDGYYESCIVAIEGNQIEITV